MSTDEYALYQQRDIEEAQLAQDQDPEREYRRSIARDMSDYQLNNPYEEHSSDFMRHVSAGIGDLGIGVQGIKAKAQTLIGDTEGAKQTLEQAAQDQAGMAQMRPNSPSYSTAETPGEYIEATTMGIAQSIPSMVGILLGGIGGGVATTMASRALAATVSKTALKLGSTSGALTGGALPFEATDVQTLVDAPEEELPHLQAVSAGKNLVNSALNLVAPFGVAKGIQGQLAGEVSERLAKRVTKGALKTAAVETPTEIQQEVNDILFERYVAGDMSGAVTQEEKNRLIDTLVAAPIGALFGGLGAAVPSKPGMKIQINKEDAAQFDFEPETAMEKAMQEAIKNQSMDKETAQIIAEGYSEVGPRKDYHEQVGSLSVRPQVAIPGKTETRTAYDIALDEFPEVARGQGLKELADSTVATLEYGLDRAQKKLAWYESNFPAVLARAKSRTDAAEKIQANLDFKQKAQEDIESTQAVIAAYRAGDTAPRAQEVTSPLLSELEAEVERISRKDPAEAQAELRAAKEALAAERKRTQYRTPAEKLLQSVYATHNVQELTLPKSERTVRTPVLKKRAPNKWRKGTAKETTVKTKEGKFKQKVVGKAGREVPADAKSAAITQVGLTNVQKAMDKGDIAGAYRTLPQPHTTYAGTDKRTKDSVATKFNSQVVGIDEKGKAWSISLPNLLHDNMQRKRDAGSREFDEKQPFMEQLARTFSIATADLILDKGITPKIFKDQAGRKLEAPGNTVVYKTAKGEMITLRELMPYLRPMEAGKGKAVRGYKDDGIDREATAMAADGGELVIKDGMVAARKKEAAEESNTLAGVFKGRPYELAREVFDKGASKVLASYKKAELQEQARTAREEGDPDKADRLMSASKNAWKGIGIKDALEQIDSSTGVERAQLLRGYLSEWFGDSLGKNPSDMRAPELSMLFNSVEAALRNPKKATVTLEHKETKEQALKSQKAEIAGRVRAAKAAVPKAEVEPQPFPDTRAAQNKRRQRVRVQVKKRKVAKEDLARAKKELREAGRHPSAVPVNPTKPEWKGKEGVLKLTKKRVSKKKEATPEQGNLFLENELNPDTIEQHPQIHKTETLQVLESIAKDAGWAEVGGKLLRNAEGKVTGRTKWIPSAAWFSKLEGVKVKDYLDGVARLKKQVPLDTKARNKLGTKLTKPQRLAVTAIMEEWEQITGVDAAEIEPSTFVPTTIISGGQTGADIAGLKAAKALGIKTGGTGTKGFRTAEGYKPQQAAEYGMTEGKSLGFPERTKANVDNSDATIAFSYKSSAGTDNTIKYAKTGYWGKNKQYNWKGKKPVLVIVSKKMSEVVAQIKAFLEEHMPQTLNIAGHREGSVPGLEAFVTKALTTTLGVKKPAETINVYYGTKENAELSNLARRPFKYGNKQYWSVEHAYQTLKSGKFDPVTHAKYKSSAGVKIRGKRARTDNSWHIKLMEVLMKRSFLQNPDAAATLVIEADNTFTHTQDKGEWGKEFPRILQKLSKDKDVVAVANTPIQKPAIPVTEAGKTPDYALALYKQNKEQMLWKQDQMGRLSDPRTHAGHKKSARVIADLAPRIERLKQQVAELKQDQADLVAKHPNIATELEARLEKSRPKNARDQGNTSMMGGGTARTDMIYAEYTASIAGMGIKEAKRQLWGKEKKLEEWKGMGASGPSSRAIGNVTAEARALEDHIKKLETDAAEVPGTDNLTTPQKRNVRKFELFLEDIKKSLPLLKDVKLEVITDLKKSRNAKAIMYASSSEGTITLNPAALLGKPEEMMPIFMHEIGHHVEYNYYDQATPEIKAALHAEFEAYKGKTSQQTTSAGVLGTLKDTFGIQDQGIKNTNVTFREWYAEQVNAWLQTSTKPKTIIEKHFAGLAALFKALYQKYVDVTSGPTETIDQFMNSIWVRTPEAPSTYVTPAFTKGTVEENAANIAASLASPERKVRAAGMHAAIDHVLSAEERKKLYRAFTTKRAIKQLEQHLEPAVLEHASTEPDEYIVQSYLLWQEGKIKIGPQMGAIFDTILEFVRKHLGIVSRSKQVEEILTSITNAQKEVLSDKITNPMGVIYGAHQLTDTTAQRAVSNLRELAQKPKDLFERAFFPAYTRLDRKSNPVMRQFIDKTFPEIGRNVGTAQGEAILSTTNKILNQVYSELEDFTKTDMQEWNQAMMENTDGTSDKVKHAVNLTRDIYKAMDKYKARAGVEAGTTKEYHTVSWSTEQIDKDPQLFDANVEILKDEHMQRLKDVIAKGTNEEQIISAKEELKTLPKLTGMGIRTLLAKYDGMEDTDMMSRHNAGIPMSTPYSGSDMRRALGFLSRGDAAKELMSQFQDQEYLITLQKYVRHTVRKSEFTRRFGGSEGVKVTLNKMFEQARKYGMTPEEEKVATQFLEAQVGITGYNIDPKYRKAMGWVVTALNLSLLPFVTLSSIVDPLNLALRTRGDTKALKAGVKQAGEEIKVALQDDPKHSIMAKLGFTRLNQKERKTRARELAETIGTVETYMGSEVVKQLYGNAFLTGAQRTINDKFFQLTGIDAWTRMTRVMGVASAEEFLKNNAGNKKWMAELGLKEGDIQPGGDLEILNAIEWIEANKKGETDKLEKSERIETAINRWVNQTMLRPGPGIRPLWFNDPRFMLLSYLRDFQYAVLETTLKQMAYVVSGEAGMSTKAGGALVAATVMAYAPVFLIGELLRDTIQHEDGEDPNKKGWTWGDHLRNAFIRAGLLGPMEMGLDAYEEGERNKIPVGAFLGPVWDKGSKGFNAATNSQEGAVVKWVKGMLPMQSVWRYRWDDEG